MIRPVLSSNTPSLVLEVDHASAASEARRMVAQLSSAAGLDEVGAGRAAIIVNELVTNLVKHASGGSLFMHGGAAHVDICAVDRGPGMSDVSLSMRDGYSSAGTAGNGLGAVRRVATEFDVFSTLGRGTTVFARVTADREKPEPMLSRAGAFWRPMVLDDLCGDACAVFESDDHILCVVADGLGHGVAAAEASRAAVAVAAQSTVFEPPRILERMHAALRPTRGAAAAVALIDRKENVLRFSGIGNIAASIINDHTSKSLVSVSGIVGHQARSFQEFRYEWSGRPLLVMHSDGVSARWSLDSAPGLANRHPATIAAVLGRDFARERDDRCVLAYREERS